jgi:hypothetical protein
MGKSHNKAATPSAWIRIDPYTGMVTKKGKAQVQQLLSGQSFWERSISVASHVLPVPAVQPKATPLPMSGKEAQSPVVALRPGFVHCDACGATLKEKRLTHHQQEKCPARLNQVMVYCPNCKRRILQEQLSPHLKSCRPRPKPLTVTRPPSLKVQVNPHPRPSNQVTYEQTGVFYDEGNFIVVYCGEVIANVGDAAYGWELLEHHRQRVKQK